MKQSVEAKTSFQPWNGKSVLFQIIIILGIFCVYYDLAWYRPYDCFNTHIAVVILAVVNLVELALLIIWLVRYFKKIVLHIGRLLKQHFEILILDVIFGFTSISNLGDWLSNDGSVYYEYLTRLLGRSCDPVLNLRMCGHQNGFSVMWYMLGELLRPNYVQGVRCMMVLIALITITALYGILKNMYPQRSRVSIILITAIFAFHPMVWGLLAEFNTDFFVMAAFVWMVYFMIKKRYLFMAYSGLLVCYAKENGVVIYAAFMVGWLIWEVIRCVKDKKLDVTKRVMPFLINCIGGLIWIAEYKFRDGAQWDGGFSAPDESLVALPNVHKANSFGIWPMYIQHLLKEFLFINYGWVYLIIAIILVVCLILFRKKVEWPRIDGSAGLGMILGSLGFFGFTLGYITWTNYRYYIMLSFVEVMIVALLLLGVLKVEKWRSIIAVALVALSVVSNFYPDILAPRFLKTVNLGNGYMADGTFYRYDAQGIAHVDEISDTFVGYGDLGVNNQEYKGRGRCFDEMLKDIAYDENTLIIMPLLEGRPFYLFGHNEDPDPDYLYVRRDNLKLEFNSEMIFYELAPEIFMKLNIQFYDGAEGPDTSVYDNYERVFVVHYTFNDEFDEADILSNGAPLQQFDITKMTTKCTVYQIK